MWFLDELEEKGVNSSLGGASVGVECILEELGASASITIHPLLSISTEPGLFFKRLVVFSALRPSFRNSASFVDKPYKE